MNLSVKQFVISQFRFLQHVCFHLFLTIIIQPWLHKMQSNTSCNRPIFLCGQYYRRSALQLPKWPHPCQCHQRASTSIPLVRKRTSEDDASCKSSSTTKRFREPLGDITNLYYPSSYWLRRRWKAFPAIFCTNRNNYYQQALPTMLAKVERNFEVCPKTKLYLTRQLQIMH